MYEADNSTSESYFNSHHTGQTSAQWSQNPINDACEQYWIAISRYLLWVCKFPNSSNFSLTRSGTMPSHYWPLSWSRLPCLSSEDSRKTAIARIWLMDIPHPSHHPPQHRPVFKKDDITVNSSFRFWFAYHTEDVWSSISLGMTPSMGETRPEGESMPQLRAYTNSKRKC